MNNFLIKPYIHIWFYPLAAISRNRLLVIGEYTFGSFWAISPDRFTESYPSFIMSSMWTCLSYLNTTSSNHWKKLNYMKKSTSVLIWSCLGLTVLLPVRKMPGNHIKSFLKPPKVKLFMVYLFSNIEKSTYIKVSLAVPFKIKTLDFCFINVLERNWFWLTFC